MKLLERTQIKVNVSNNKHTLFNEIFYPLSGAVEGYAMQLTRNVADADDLAQETFTTAFDKINQYTPGTNAKAWILTICRNKFINGYRKVKARPITVELAEDRVSDEDVASVLDVYSTELNIDLAHYGDEVQGALDRLSTCHREVIFLWVEKMPYKEISDVLNVEVGTVRSRISRAREILTADLSEYARKNGISNDD